MKQFTKNLFLIVLLCSWSLWSAQAVPVFVVNGQEYAHMAHICMPHHGNGTNDSIVVSYTGGSLQDITWQAIGDLVLTSNPNSSTATFKSTNFGKGVVRLRYNSGICGSSLVDLHVYKEFSPEAHNLVIEGPDCLTPGETVVFSVRPVLTRNLNAYIGVDSYFWNLTDTGANKPTFVDHIVYAAGDGSSVTFVAGTVHAGDEVRVNFGECNTEASKTVIKTLGKVPPRPEVTDMLCVPYGGAPMVRVFVNNPVEGVDYTCQVPSQYKSVKVSSTSVVAFDVTFDKGSADDISIRAMYKDEEACGSSESVVHIVRTWGESVALEYKGSGICCAEVSPSSSYEFELTGDIPTGSQIYWDLPRGWKQDANHSSGNTTAIFPTTAAAPMDTLRAWGDACNNEAADTVSIVVYVKPASVAAIDGPSCVAIGEADTFRVVLNNDGAAPVAYRWTTSDGQNLSTYTGNYAVITPTANTTTISVQPLGAGVGCDAAVFTDTLAFMPIAPGGIASSGCIAYNMPDTVTFSIVEPVVNQQYAWTIPNAWTLVESRNNGREIDVRTTGVAGEYVISAYSVGTGICGNSAAADTIVRIETVSAQIGYNPMWGGMFGFDPYQNTSNYYWYYVSNGTNATTNVFRDNKSLVVSCNDSFPDIDFLNTTNTVVLEYTTEKGCRARLTYGAPLNPAVDYRAMIPASAQKKSARKEMSNSGEKALIVSPNPTSAELSVGLQDNTPFELYIIDMSGKVVYQNTSAQSNYLLEVSAWKQDTYMVFAMQNGKRVSYSKFIKQ